MVIQNQGCNRAIVIISAQRRSGGSTEQLIRDSLYVTSALDFFRPAVSNRKTIASLIYTEGGMNLRDALRHAEQQGKKQVQRGAEKLHDVETSLRRKFE